jgi:CHAD domain-containing protein
MSDPANDDFPLLTYLDGLVENLRNLVSSAISGEDPDAVHDARVATRRLKAATDLVKEVVSGRCRRPFNRVGRCLRQQLGPLRDIDVMLEHAREIKQPQFHAGVQWFSERLRQRREEVVREASNQAPPARILARLGSWWGLRHEINDARKSVLDLLTQSVHLQLDAFVEQAIDLVGARHNDPHQLRIAGKSLRYTLEMAREHGVELSRSVLLKFKRMQNALGLWHDYAVLAERILSESVECDLALHQPHLQSELLGIAQLALRKSELQLKKMAGLWKSRGEELSQTIRQAFPLTPHIHDPPATPEELAALAEAAAHQQAARADEAIPNSAPAA